MNFHKKRLCNTSFEVFWIKSVAIFSIRFTIFLNLNNLFDKTCVIHVSLWHLIKPQWSLACQLGPSFWISLLPKNQKLSSALVVKLSFTVFTIANSRQYIHLKHPLWKPYFTNASTHKVNTPTFHTLGHK